MGKNDVFDKMVEYINHTSLSIRRYRDTVRVSKTADKVNPADLIRMAKSDRITTAKTEAKIARIMVNNYYNKGKGATPLEYKFNF